MLKEELKHIRETKKDLRKFGLTVGGVLILLAAVLFYFTKPSAVYFAVIGGILVLLGITYAQALKPLTKIWMGLAIVLGFFMSRLILTILFYFVLTPIAILAKLFSKKFMPIKPDKNISSYWEKRSAAAKQHIDYERQF